MRLIRHQGFVLLIILVFLQLFALLSAHYLWNKVRSKQQLKLQMSAMAARETAVILLNKWSKRADICHTEMATTRFLQRQSEPWWQAHACFQSTELHAYFLREDIMSDVCTAITSQPSQRVHYYRDTVMVASAAGAIVQDTFAASDSQPVDCHHPVRLISPGRQTLRWLR
jgi:type II secretory pathway component PulJ